MEILRVLIRLLPIILILLLGAWFKQVSFISAETVRGLKKITLGIALPCLLFLTFFKAEMKAELLILAVIIFAACLLEFALGFFITKLQKSSNHFAPSLYTTFLTGPIGFPLFSSYFGAENLYKLAILDFGNSIFIFTVLTAFLSTVSCSVNATEKKSISTHLQNLIKSPLTVGMCLGIIISLTGFSPALEKFPPTAAFLDAVALMSSAAFPLSLLIIGYDLPFNFRNFWKTISQVLLRLTMMLSIAYLINTYIIVGWLGLDEIFQMALYTMFILPPPFIIPLSIIGECEHKTYVLDFISLHLVVSLLAFVILISLFQ